IGYFYTPGAGSEDRWEIAFGYTPDSARAAGLARQGAQAGHALGTDEDGQTAASLDPSVSIFDLSSDPLGWARQRTALVKSLIPKLPTSALADNSPAADLTGALGNMLNQYAQAVGYAVKYVGGQYVYRDHKGDPNGRPPFVNVPRAKQKEALDFLTGAAFSDTSFSIPAGVLTQLGTNRWAHWGSNTTFNGRTDYPLHEQILGVQTGLLARLTSPFLFARIRDAETKFGAANVLTIPELVQQLTQATWSEVLGATGKNIDASRRDLQRAYLDRMSDIVATPPAGMPADARSVVRYRLMDLRTRINAKLAAPATLDGYTVAHLTDAKARIDHALEAGLDVEKAH
ncbi:MAG TPA: zinc-dependent metalloprotease, partial [Gemmatimonadales bacterium]